MYAAVTLCFQECLVLSATTTFSIAPSCTQATLSSLPGSNQSKNDLESRVNHLSFAGFSTKLISASQKGKVWEKRRQMAGSRRSMELQPLLETSYRLVGPTKSFKLVTEGQMTIIHRVTEQQRMVIPVS